MDAFECITTKLEVRQFANRHVPADVKSRVLEAARLTGSSMNTQHWRFIVIQDRVNLKRLADDSTSGSWSSGCDFAVVILTDPSVPGYTIDGGRVLQDMQLAAWNFGVASGVFTGFKEDNMRRNFAIPEYLQITAVACFGYAIEKIAGMKNRKSLNEIAFGEKFGSALSFV